MLVAIGAYAQGTVNFSARVVGVYDAPVYVGSVGGTKAEGAAYLAQMYAGPTDNALAAIGTALPFRTGTAAGYWTATALAIPTVAPGANAQVQIKAWAAASGATFEAASSAGGQIGQSAIFTVKTGGDGSPPSLPGTFPATLTSFAISGGGGPVVPEPSILALGALGGLALLLRRRK